MLEAFCGLLLGLLAGLHIGWKLAFLGLRNAVEEGLITVKDNAIPE